tara:strand:+ start:873 stop:1013 length:141 start_codon:yes stop_codon:yes gene_type:complete
MYNKEELKEVLKFLKLTEQQLDLLSKVMYDKSIKAKVESNNRQQSL